jgi:acyl-CoA thioesterase I
MRGTELLYRVLLAACLSFTLTTLPTRAETPSDPSPKCAAPKEYLALGQPLVRTALSLASGEPVKIVAVGSSSTAGAGASSPSASYPAQLEAELKTRYPGIAITVLNRGVNGEDAKQMLARFEETVLAEKPDLVIWQVGTNAVLRDHALDGETPLIREGIRRLKAAQADIVLMDPQYAPKVIVKPDVAGMVDLIGAAAHDEKIGVFHRFAVMQHWSTVERIGFDQLLSPDGLHMNDWSYACVAKLLAGSIADAARTRPVAGVPPRRQ